MHRPGLLNQSDFVPAGHLAMSRHIIGCHNRDQVGSLASRELSLGMLLGTLLCTGQFLTAKGYLAPSITRAKARG